MHRFTLLVSYFTGLIIKLNCASEVLHSLAKTHLHNEHRLHLDFQPFFFFISSSDDENDKDNDNDSDKNNNNDNDNDNNKNNDNENDDDDSCPVPSG